MVYKYREERRVIENDGNIGLFVDSGNIFYTEIDGKKVNFYAEYIAPGHPIGRAWWGYHTWSWYAAERVDDYIKIVDRTWAYPWKISGALSDKTSRGYADIFWYEVINFTLDGKLVSKDFPVTDPFGLLGNPRAYRYGVESHADYLKSLVYRLNSPLEQWVLNNESILKEFTENINDKTILLEDWAYKKFVELYPGQKVPSTYGIEGNYPSAETSVETSATSTSINSSNPNSATSIELQQLYIAYFSRPCDPSGLDYWTKQGISRSDFAANMYLQPEFKNVNGSLSIEYQVNQIYLNLFNRDADPEGLLYWTTQIIKGSLQLASIANDLIWAAENNPGGSDDSTTLSNKTNAAIAYTAKIETTTALMLDYLPQSTSPWVTGSNFTEAKNYISGIGQYNRHTSLSIDSSVAKFGSLSSSSSYKLLIDPNLSNVDSITGL